MLLEDHGGGDAGRPILHVRLQVIPCVPIVIPHHNALYQPCVLIPLLMFDVYLSLPILSREGCIEAGCLSVYLSVGDDFKVA